MVRNITLGVLLLIALIGPMLYRGTYQHWFFTAQQIGDWKFFQADYAGAAEAYGNPSFKGTSYYRDGDFKQAATYFTSNTSADARYNLGNALLMGGDYDNAIASYQQALKQRPNWPEAEENLSIARARADKIKREGGEGTGGKLGADDVVFDNNAPSNNSDSEQTEQVAGDSLLSEAEKQAMWLRKVQTQPADFLKVKFQYQTANEISQ